MTLESQIVLSMTLYKLASLAVGLCSLYMGYRLFMSGIWGQAGDVDIKFQSNYLLIKRAAPGTFFVVLGTIIVCATLLKGLEFYAPPSLNITSQTLPSNESLPDHAPVSGEH